MLIAIRTMISMAHNWDSFLYQFIVGGIVLLAGIVIPIIKKDVKLSNRDDQLTIAAILGAPPFSFSFI